MTSSFEIEFDDYIAINKEGFFFEFSSTISWILIVFNDDERVKKCPVSVACLAGRDI